MANTILNFHFDYWHPSLSYDIYICIGYMLSTNMLYMFIILIVITVSVNFGVQLSSKISHSNIFKGPNLPQHKKVLGKICRQIGEGPICWGPICLELGQGTLPSVRGGVFIPERNSPTVQTSVGPMCSPLYIMGS